MKIIPFLMLFVFAAFAQTAAATDFRIDGLETIGQVTILFNPSVVSSEGTVTPIGYTGTSVPKALCAELLHTSEDHIIDTGFQNGWVTANTELAFFDEHSLTFMNRPAPETYDLVAQIWCYQDQSMAPPIADSASETNGVLTLNGVHLEYDGQLYPVVLLAEHFIDSLCKTYGYQQARSYQFSERLPTQDFLSLDFRIIPNGVVSLFVNETVWTPNQSHTPQPFLDQLVCE